MLKIDLSLLQKNLIFKFKLLVTCMLAMLLTNTLNAQWTRVADALRKRGECPSIVYNNKVYVFGGYGEHPNFENDNEVYDPATNSWSLIASFPAGKAISHQCVVLVDDKIWQIGGRAVNADGPVTSQVIIYDITNNTWSDGPELKDPATGQSLPLGGGGAVLIGRKIHYVGGFGPLICNDQSKYHLTIDVDKWNADHSVSWENKLAPMPLPRNHISYLTTGGKIYIIGGQFGHDCSGADQKYCHVYDPITNAWKRLIDLPAPRSHAEAATIFVDGKILVAGGQGAGSAAQNTVYQFDPAANNGSGAFTILSEYQLPANYFGISAKVINDKYIWSHGALTAITNERLETYVAPYPRNHIYKLGFTGPCFTKDVNIDQHLPITNILYTSEDVASYTLSSSAAWLKLQSSVTGSVGITGSELQFEIDATGLAIGKYSGTVTVTPGAASSAYSASSFCVIINVTANRFTVTTSVAGNGSVSKSPDQADYSPNSEITLTATPGSTERFTGWSGDTTTSVNPLTITLLKNRNIQANFSSANSIIQDVTANSALVYTVDVLSVNNTYHTDRTYPITGVPSYLDGVSFIKNPNDDKKNTTTNLLSFTLTQDADVYIAYDPRATALPEWMSGYQKITDVLNVNDGSITYMTLYFKRLAAGRYTVGGNLASPAAGSVTNYIVIAKAAPVQAGPYALTVGISGNGTVSKNPDQPNYTAGTSVSLTATAATGFQFSGWSGDASGSTNPLSVTMNSAKSVTGTFVPIQYSITLNAATGGNASKSPSQNLYDYGTSVQLTATPATGYQFTGWSGDATGNTNPLTITVNGNKNITPIFTLQKLAVTITASGGSVSKNPDQATYDYGTSVTLTATPDANKQFTGWSGDASGNTNPLTITVDGNKNITAGFTDAGAVVYTLTTSASGSGSITRNPDQASYSPNTDVILTAVPAAGQQFTGWSGNASGTTNPLPVKMDASKSIVATFAPTQQVPLLSNVSATTASTYVIGTLAKSETFYTDRTYQVTALPAYLNGVPFIKTPNADKGNKTTNLLSFSLAKDANLYVAYDPRATALPAWLSGWQKLSDVINTNDPGINNLQLYTKAFTAGRITLGGALASPAKGALTNYFVAARVLPPLYTLTLSATGQGAVSKSPNQATFDSNSVVTLSAIPASGQQFTGWNGDASGSQNPLSVTMSSNKSIVANFTNNTPSKSLLFTDTASTVEVGQGQSSTLAEYLSASDNNPANTSLSASDEYGNVPGWLTVNNAVLNGISYTSGSEITFNIDATNLSVGSHRVLVQAAATGYASASLWLNLSITFGSGGPLANVKINFQDSATVPPAGWLKDFGQKFGQRTSQYQGTGYTYGWLNKSTGALFNITKNGRKRTTPADVLLATLMHMQKDFTVSTSGTPAEAMWEMQVANGNYDVTVSVGDGSYVDSKHTINVEGVNAINNFIPTTAVRFRTATISVTVSDNLLTVDAAGGTNTKINFITITPSTGSRPSIKSVNPENGATNVSENTSISTDILDLPNGGINNATITSANVFLTEDASGLVVPANVNGTGGGDAITLVPSSPLKLGTSYTFSITSGVKDLSGAAFIPYSSSFITGAGSTSELTNVAFDTVSLTNTVGHHSSLTIGPDGKLYALSIDGIIKRFTINPDGTLQDPQLIYSLQDAAGTRTPRLAIGMTFDPSSTASNLILWITNSTYVFTGGPDWDGKLTKLTGANLENVQNVLINLPRSAKDHLTNSIAFGPDGALYFTQGSNSAMGKADKTWGNREEHLLSGAVLRLNVAALGTLPLDVKTAEGGGTYNPYQANAPLTIYASGVRNAYDLVWHSNGNLYVATNGSAAGGNTPASVAGTRRPDGSLYNGPAIPALTSVQQTQKDFLFRIKKGGYYGHPNSLRGEYVLNGGNPSALIDSAQVNDYPIGTMPDANWRGYSYDFQNNKSPNGSIEYKGQKFNGALAGKLIIVRYSQNDDLITLTPGGANNDIVGATEGAYIKGFTGFIDPLDLTEDTLTGNIYVSEYGGDGKIKLLRVHEQPAALQRNITNVNDSNVSQRLSVEATDKLSGSNLKNNTSQFIAINDRQDSVNNFESPRLYPNPFHSQFQLKFPSFYKGIYTLQILDMKGKRYDLGKISLKAGGSALDINISKISLTPGSYFLNIMSEKRKHDVIKLIVQ